MKNHKNIYFRIWLHSVMRTAFWGFGLSLKKFTYFYYKEVHLYCSVNFFGRLNPFKKKSLWWFTGWPKKPHKKTQKQKTSQEKLNLGFCRMCTFCQKILVYRVRIFVEVILFFATHLTFCFVFCFFQNVFDCNKKALPDFPAADKDSKETQICHVTSQKDGRFVFPTLPCGEYKLVSVWLFKNFSPLAFDLDLWTMTQAQVWLGRAVTAN